MGRPISEYNSCDNQIAQELDSSMIEQLEQLANPQPSDSRIIMFHGEVNEASIAQVIAHMFHLANVSHEPISLVISTYGGSVDEMFSLYDVIKFLPCPVHTVALGKVMSAGVLVLATGEKGKRFVGQSSRIMIHPISSGLFGNVFELDNQNKEASRLQNLMVNCLLRETKMSRKDIDKIMKKGYDHYLTPKQAIKLGIIDQIIGE